MKTQSDKINIIIDGKEVEATAGQNLVKVATEHGFFIPTLCYFDHIDPPLGTCRTCAVKVNGRIMAGCQVHIVDGLEIEVNTDELNDQRKSVVEMLFTEGNHICPLCEKSGNCVLQALAYEMRMEVPRLPYTFPNRQIDYKPSKIMMENHRCIQCKRCVEDVYTDDGKKVFHFQQRGKDTFVAVDYEQEAKLSDEQAKFAMDICPVGTILLKEDTFGIIDHRIYDTHSIAEIETKTNEKEDTNEMLFTYAKNKKTIATMSLAGCFGCHMSMLDIDLGIIGLVQLVNFNRSPLTDYKQFNQRCHLGLIEGGCCSDENIHALKSFRAHCDILVSVGACAINGNLPSLRNWMPLKETLEDVYYKLPSSDETSIIPHHEDLPKILDKVYPCHEIVKIDYFIPGCPPSADLIWKVVQNILFATNYDIPYQQFKYD